APDRYARGRRGWKNDPGPDEGSRKAGRMDRVRLQKYPRGKPDGLDPRGRTRARLPLRVLDEEPGAEGICRSGRRWGVRGRDEEARLHRPRARNDVQGQSGEGNRIVGGDAVRKKIESHSSHRP